jgi:Leucine-rich repeat (LRR) protein
MSIQNCLNISDVFKIEGFVPTPQRDRQYERRTGETVSEVQGSPGFCQKFVQWTKENPGDWPDLRTLLTAATDAVSRTNALIITAKIIGHIFHLQGTVFVAKTRACEFEGFSETFVLPRMLWRWNAFAAAGFVSPKTHAFVADALLNALWHDNCSKEKLEEVLTKLQKLAPGQAILVGTGWVWHSTYAIFYKDPTDSEDEIRIAYCNRGNDCQNQPGIVFLKVKDKSKISLEFLQILGNRIEVKQSQYKSLQKIKEELGAEQISYTSMKTQKSGNCTYANLKAAIYALLRISEFKLEERLETALKVYKQFAAFVAYDANETLKELAHDFPSTGMLLASLAYCEKLSFPFCNFAFEKTPVPKKLDPAALQKMMQSIEACPFLKERVDWLKTSLLSNHVIQSIKSRENLTPLVFKNYSPLPLEDYSGLKQFDFIGQHLQNFPSQLAPCTNLKNLCLSNNRLTTLPSCIGALQCLQQLELRFNLLQSVPEEIGGLTNLTRLDFSANNIKTLPPAIGNLINLESLKLPNNQLSKFPEGICHLTNLTYLFLERNAIPSIPSETRNCFHLKWLDLRNNSIMVIPPEIGNCLNLEILNLDSNKIESIPTEIGNCAKLEDLNLCSNKIKLIPAEIGNCSHLRTLYLSSNQIKILPPELFQNRLEELECDRNQIQAIPYEIEKCSHLRRLELNDNLITTIPPEIMKCSNLRICRLMRNLIASIPDSLQTFFAQKSGFCLTGNPASDSTQDKQKVIYPL